MRRATRLLTVSVAVLAWSAVTAHACERSKSANASAASTACATACKVGAMPTSACSAKGASMSACSAKGANSCAAHTTTAAKKTSVTRNAAVATPKKAVRSTAGMRAYRDPETGTFTAPPTVTGIGEDGIVVVKDAPVVLNEVAIPGGGYYVDLQGTGEDYVTMRIDAKGNRVMTCAPARVAGKKKSPAAPAPAPNAFPEK